MMISLSEYLILMVALALRNKKSSVGSRKGHRAVRNLLRWIYDVSSIMYCFIMYCFVAKCNMTHQQQTSVTHHRAEQWDTRIVRLENYIVIQTAKQRRYSVMDVNPSESAVWCSWNESLCASAAHIQEMRQ
jgi:hypothetical protein